MQEKGTISIHTENIFPIIKKFLYSDHEIFLRELVSNGVDAAQKLQKLAQLGEYKGEQGDLKVTVTLDKEAKTITVSDNGIGMTAEEIKKYINQIAFSGATEFIEKYKDKGEDKQIIGHFGLGFYSSFMVAEKVEIITRSFKEDAQAARWICDGSTEFEITDAEKSERGTDIILHVNSESEEFLDHFRLKGILEKYCRFLPVPVFFNDGEKAELSEEEKKEGKEAKAKEPEQINDPNPIWTKAPADLKDEDYQKFYKELYPFAPDPLFWIHLNVDYPFNLTGVLYFPKIKNDFEIQKNKIQLYSRQVFITDEVKDVVPEFLQLLHGVIDSPDIPLNVSRSFLQADSNVKKINSHITKKVADKLGELFKNDRKAYEEKWEHIGLFVKYGMISEDKFYDRAKDFALVKNTEGKHFTLNEYKEQIKANQTDKDGNAVILYTTDSGKQHAYIQAARKRSYDVLELDSVIDSHFINMLEQKLEKTSLKRVDSDTIDKLIDKDEKKESVLSDEEKEKVKGIFEKAINNKNYSVQVEAMATDEMPVAVTMPEFMRRMKDMSAAGGGGMQMFGNFPDNYTVSVNANHAISAKLLKESDEAKQVDLAKQAFDLGLLQQNMLQGAELTAFIQRSVDLATK
jgi:molecular chaperone HtpG